MQLDKMIAKIRKAREDAGLSITDAAAKAGLMRANWSRVESGQVQQVTYTVVAKMAKAVGLKITVE